MFSVDVKQQVDSYQAILPKKEKKSRYDAIENFVDFVPYGLQTTLILRVVWFERLLCLNIKSVQF